MILFYHDLLIGIMSMSRVDSSVGKSSNERLCKSTAAKGSSSSSSMDTPAPSSGLTSGKIFVSRLNCGIVDVWLSTPVPINEGQIFFIS